MIPPGGMPPSNPLREAFTACARLDTDLVRQLAREHTLYVVFITPRSGSTWLEESCRLSGRLGTPHEWFHPTFVARDVEKFGCRSPRAMGTSDINAYVRRAVEDTRSPAGCAGVELSAQQAQWLCALCEDVGSLASSPHPFYLRRGNLVAQAVSLYRSAASGYFHSFQPEDKRKRFDAVDYDVDGIRRAVASLVDDELWFEDMFRRYALHPHRLLYEDLLAGMDDVLAWMQQALDLTPGASAPLDATSRVSRLSDARSLEWEQRFLAEEPAFLSHQSARRPVVTSDVGIIA